MQAGLVRQRVDYLITSVSKPSCVAHWRLTSLAVIANGAAEALNQQASNSDGVKMLTDGINTLVNSLPALVRALDELAKIHPFVASEFAYRQS